MGILYSLNIFLTFLLQLWSLWFSSIVVGLDWINLFSIFLVLALPVQVMMIIGGPITLIDGGLFDFGYQFHPALYPQVPVAANMIPDAVLMARDLFPQVYAGSEFNFSAMWAYICRLGFVSNSEVLRHRAAIARSHPFSLASFLSRSAVHELSAVRRTVLNKFMPLGELKHRTPDNIHDFVRTLAPSRGPATA